MIKHFQIHDGFARLVIVASCFVSRHTMGQGAASFLSTANIWPVLYLPFRELARVVLADQLAQHVPFIFTIFRGLSASKVPATRML